MTSEQKKIGNQNTFKKEVDMMDKIFSSVYKQENIDFNIKQRKKCLKFRELQKGK